MVSEVASKSPLETGGVLLGYWVRQPTASARTRRKEFGSIVTPEYELVVAQSVGPGPHAVHLPDAFIPDHEFQETEIARVYRASGRTVTYLGDWHCHPCGPAVLSRKDLVTLNRIAGDPCARAPTPLMLIVKGDDLARSRLWCLLRPSAALPPPWLWRARIMEFRIRGF